MSLECLRHVALVILAMAALFRKRGGCERCFCLHSVDGILPVRPFMRGSGKSSGTATVVHGLHKRGSSIRLLDEISA